jgi:acetyl esterase
MLNTAIHWLAGLLQPLKVWGLRWFYRLESAWNWRRDGCSMPHIDMRIPVGDVAIGARLYVNALGADRPLILYIHGGGWVIGDLQSHHPFCRALAHHSGCSVIALDYRLAPEHPFPAAQDDCLAAAAWVAERATGLAPCNGKLVIAGDSAGGNLASCTCLELAESARDKFIGAVLIYPATDHYSVARASYTEKATGQALTTSLMQWFWDNYLGGKSPDDPGLQRAFPLRADNIASLPPTLLVTAENDPLRDEGIAFAELLRQHGVPVDYHHVDDADHGFACGHGPSRDFRVFIGQLDGWLRQLEANS